MMSGFNIRTLSENLFAVDDVVSKNPIGRRMTIIRLKNGNLALHSPIFLEGDAKLKLDALGQIAYILVPNAWHTLDTKKVHEQYPDSKIMVPLGLKENLAQRFPVHGTYEENWTDLLLLEIDVCIVGGLKKPEALLFHKDSKTLVLADLFFNFLPNDFSGFTKLLMNFNQATRFGTTRIYQWSMVKNKAEFKSSLEEIQKKWDVLRIIMGHGHIVEKDGGHLIDAALANL